MSEEEELQIVDDIIKSQNPDKKLLIEQNKNDENIQEIENKQIPKENNNLRENEQKIQKEENNENKQEKPKDNYNEKENIDSNKQLSFDVDNSNFHKLESQNNADIINNIETPIKKNEDLNNKKVSNNIINNFSNATNNNSSTSLNTEYKKMSSNEKKMEDDTNSNLTINININNSLPNNNNNNNKSEINSNTNTNISKIKATKNKVKIDKTNKKINKKININDLDNYLNNKIISESVYYQYNSLFLNKQFLNNTKKYFKNKENKKYINHNKNNSVDCNNDKSDKFNETYRRFIDEQKKKKEKIIELKKMKEEKEKNSCYNKPKINKKSQELVSKTKENFYERQKKLMEEKKKKNSILKEKIKKKEIDDINKTNILLTQNKEKNKNNRKKSMDEVIKQMYEWDEKRKEKINNKIKNKEINIKKNLKDKPQINKNSYLITVNRNPNKIFNRLYIDDVIKRREKQKLLEYIYKPSFKPHLIEEKSPNKKFNSCMNSRLNTKRLNTVQNDKKIMNEELEEEEINKLIRGHLFRKNKNKKRYNTSENINRNENVRDKILIKKRNVQFIL